MKEYEYRDENGNPLDYYIIVNDATQMLKEIEEKDKEIKRLNNIIDELETELEREIDIGNKIPKEASNYNSSIDIKNTLILVLQRIKELKEGK